MTAFSLLTDSDSEISFKMPWCTASVTLHVSPISWNASWNYDDDSFNVNSSLCVIDESDKRMHHYSDARKNICSTMYNWYGITDDSEIVFVRTSHK